MFLPLYDAANEFTFYASDTSQATFKKLFYGLSQADNLPVPSQMLRAKLKFTSIAPDMHFTLDHDVKVSTYQLNHQGVTLGYRVEQNGHSACVITDNAPIFGGNYLGESMRERAAQSPLRYETSFNDGLVNFLRHAHTVVYDTHFTDMNLKPDWGHSTPNQALDFAIRAEVKRLILFHHAPEESDADVDAKLESVIARGAKHGVSVEAAVEGKVWDLG
jgi:phosphoribosyl 1,2-cyclic phosphodiesterase